MTTITTYTGISFAPLSPNPEQINLTDIAHSLSLLCRGNGHLVHFYSVGQHSLNCAREAAARGYSRRVQLACLMHDGSEAYLSDVPRPLKAVMADYLALEERLQDVIYELYLGSPLTPEELAQVTEIDDDMLAAEFPVLKAKNTLGRSVTLQSTPDFAVAPFAEVEEEFLQLAADLAG